MGLHFQKHPPRNKNQFKNVPLLRNKVKNPEISTVHSSFSEISHRASKIKKVSELKYWQQTAYKMKE